MQKYYYHGSNYELNVGDYLEPRSSKVINNEKAVFSTNNRLLAIIFIAKHTNDDFEFGFYNGKLYMMEQYPDAFKIKLGKVSGWVYYLNKKPFKKDQRLGLKNSEFISRKKEKIIKKEYIKDVYKALKKSTLIMITFKEKMDALERCGKL